MKRLLAAALLVLGSAPAFAAGPETVVQNGFGCLSKDDFLKAIKFATQDDLVAFNKFIEQQVNAGSCRIFKPGDIVFVDQKSIHSTMCARPKGEIECVWTAVELTSAVN